MKKKIIISSSLIGLAVIAGLIFYSNQERGGSSMSQGLDAITSAMGRRGSGNVNTSADAREGTSADTVAAPSDFPVAYNYGSGRMEDYTREDMLRKTPQPSGNQTVFNTEPDTRTTKLFTSGKRAMCLRKLALAVT